MPFQYLEFENGFVAHKRFHAAEIFPYANCATLTDAIPDRRNPDLYNPNR